MSSIAVLSCFAPLVFVTIGRAREQASTWNSESFLAPVIPSTSLADRRQGISGLSKLDDSLRIFAVAEIGKRRPF